MVGGGDDLTAIRGIGIAKAIRLNGGGIGTYEQLARSTPEEQTAEAHASLDQSNNMLA